MTQLGPGEMSMSRRITELAAAHPERIAIRDHEGTITFGELDRRTNRLARAYADLGVGQDDFVTIALPNGIAFYEAAIATLKLGATVQPVSHRLPFVERDAIVQLAEPALVVGVEPGTHGDRPTVPIGFAADAALADGELPDRVARCWKAPTSGGSTGRPKIIASGQASVVRLGPSPVRMTEGGTQLVPGPLYHNAPFIYSMDGLMRGKELVVMERFDAARCLELLERHRVDWVLMVPTMMNRIWKLPEDERLGRDLSALRTLLHLAAPCPPWLKDAFIEWLGADVVCELYAGTEGQAATWLTGSEWQQHRGSVGRALFGEFTILDDAGRPVPPGEIGEVWMRTTPGSPSTYRYIGAEAKARDDGWESLGDLGSMDADGFVYLADRRTDMILTGGANVYPAEIEAALDEHPQIRSSAVIGLPDDDMGQRLHAIVQADGPLDERDVLAHLAARLVTYKLPRSFEQTTEPLRDDAGKVRRSALRAERIPT